MDRHRAALPVGGTNMSTEAHEEKLQGVWGLGTLLADRYEIEEVVKPSATCCLYRVRDVFRGTSHLIVGPGRLACMQDGGLIWFEQYCQRSVSIPAHPNVLTPKRVDHHRKIAFLLMPDFEGKFWDAAIKEGDLRDVPGMLSVATQTARGLAWLHRQGCIHFNVKPANVVLCDSGFTKVWKYGENGASTRAYASPEQISGQPLTPSTDIWSWGVSVLHMFVGKVTWPSGHLAAAILERYVRNGPAVQDTAVMPSPLVELLAQCFHADVTERPADMKEVVTVLESMTGVPPQVEAGS
jgi:serine/threonine protein kinase